MSTRSPRERAEHPSRGDQSPAGATEQRPGDLHGACPAPEIVTDVGQGGTMATRGEATSPTQKESWVPMIVIGLGQAIMSFNVAALPVALSGMVRSFNVPPTIVATGIVTYSMAVAGFVMLGAKLSQRFGALNVFRVVVLLFGAAQTLMTFSPSATLM